MPFSQAIRNQALVAAARHCCVCHRYKGVKVEVHHIIPESQGGASDPENAIALCFDCHTDAGHYNPGHPRGTKFSPSELRLHRDIWHGMVSHHTIRPPGEPDRLYCRYLLCKSFDAFREVTLGELSNIPVDKPHLVTNHVRDFQRVVVERHPHKYRHDKEWGDQFRNREAYSQSYPDVRVFERSSINLYPYFEAVRTPSVEELRSRVAPTDAVTSLLIDGGVPPHEISLALAYEEVCGGGCFQEIYRLRPLWALYLAATNLESHPLTLSSLLGDQELPNGIGYRPFSRRIDSTNNEQRLPPAPIPPGGTVMVPLALLLGPIENALGEILSTKSAYIPTGQRQEFAHEDLTTVYAGTALIGPAVWPRAIRVAGSAVTSEQPIHEFNLSNLYTIDRSWEAGSCPHIFGVGEQIQYLGEIFSLTPSLRQRERFVVPDGIEKLVVAELEAETTIVEQVLINGEKVRTRVNLECGEFIELRVQPGDMVELTGYYIPQRLAPPDPWFRNSVVYEFMHGHKRC